MEKFYLGLDIGTDSAGIACTDENYELLRAKGKDLWAVRLFDESNDASKRRTFRTARRRLARRKERITLLQEIFAPYMSDDKFFLRLKYSSLHTEDKPDGLPKFALFADDDYTDRQFYAEFPTIFHLRKKLIDNGATDLRLYYLALHHIIKYRGHFLFDGSYSVGNRNLSALFTEFNSVSEQLFDDAPSLDEHCAENFLRIAVDSTERMNDKKKELFKLFGETRQMKAIVTFMLGGKSKPSDIFEDCDEKSFSLDIPDEEFDAKAETLGDGFVLFDCMRKIYKFVRLEKILGGSENVSQAMIKIYEKHGRDLANLKKLISKYYSHDLYCEVFKSTSQTANYVKYIGYTKPSRKKINVKKNNSYDEFIKYLLKALATPPEDEDGKILWESITGELNDGTFLPKILNADNGLFPHQLNLEELDKILDNLCRDFPAFGVKDGDGITPAKKIRSIFLFRIPYFVGPLNPHSENSWIVRREGKITPWNFEDKVDFERSNENFIRRMTGKCSYLFTEDVLPKCSMYYQAFDVLNQLNKLRINGEPISVALKQELFNNLFLADRQVSDKKIISYLISHGHAQKNEKIILSGKDGDFKANMRSYITLKSKLGAFADEHPEICEDIILWHTISSDKNIVEKYLLKKYAAYGEITENIKWIKGLTLFKDFGRLSYKFLMEIAGGEDAAGRKYTVLSELYNTNLNLNEILFGEKYSFRDSISDENGVRESEIGYKDVQELYVAPQLRRGIWQSLVMVDEYVKALNRCPDKIFVEVTRQPSAPELKKRTVSRKEQLLSLFETVAGIDDLKRELREEKAADLESEKLYLYYRQLGRCMYSGEQIDLLQLKSDLYDVDHIIPRSLVKDDSLDNKVLVLRSKNREKTDIYPLPDGFSNQSPFWKLLREKQLISDEKWARLTRRKPLTDEDYEGFVNRQLVYTNQMAKAVAELLKRKFGEKGTKIVYSKAANVSDFRDKFNIPKCRETNDLHHARDAYLNIVVGNVYDVRFTRLSDYFRRKESDGSQRQINLDKLFTYDVAGAWDENSLGTVRSVLSRMSMSVTRYPLIGGGAFYDQTVYGKDDDGVNTPLKGKGAVSDFKKYGGYKSLKTAYFAIVKSKDKKGNPVKTIEAIPVLVDYNAHGDGDKISAYLKDGCKLTEPELLVPCLRVKALVKVNGFPAYIAGITGSQISLHNAIQWYTDEKTDRYVKALCKLLGREKSGMIEDLSVEEFIMHTNRFGEVKLKVDRPQNEELYRDMLRQLSKKMYGGISGAVYFRNTLENKSDKFRALTVFEQAKVLVQIAKFLKCNAETSDLTLLDEKANCGKLLINKNITKTEFTVVHISACGLDVRERKI